MVTVMAIDLMVMVIASVIGWEIAEKKQGPKGKRRRPKLVVRYLNRSYIVLDHKDR